MIEYLVKTIKEYFEEICTYQIPKNLRTNNDNDDKTPPKKEMMLF